MPRVPSIRKLLCLAAISAAGLLCPAGAAADVGLAQNADRFVDSIGVNVHLEYSDSVYNDFDRVRGGLDRLGVRFIRDGISLGRPDIYARLHLLARDGIKLDAIAGDPLRRFGTGSLKAQLRMATRQLGPSVLASLEGPNEFDNQGIDNWRPILRRYQRRLWRGVRARPGLASVAVLGPSLVDPDSRAELGPIGRWTTEGNMHPYPGGEAPDRDEHLDSELALAARNTGLEPVQATETGYNNALNATTGQPATSERAAAIYMPRLFLENFRRGITRSFVYELIDNSPDPRRTETEDSYGLLRNDFSPKPAFRAIRNLIAILEDPGPGFDNGVLFYSLPGAPPDIRTLLLEKRDGSFYLALWRPQSVWDTEDSRENVPAKASTPLRFDQPVASAAVYLPNRSAAPVSTYSSPSTIDVPVGAQATIVQVVPAAAARASLSGKLPGDVDPLLSRR